MVKRIVDITLALFLLILTSPIMVGATFFLLIEAAGPVFYRGVRAGYLGKPFRIFKFRTLVVDAEKIGSGTTALNDARITPVGTFLRKYKIDELPQLLNVLSGTMSMVGPRPDLLDYAKRYKGEEELILTVKPGITDYSSIKFFDEENWVGESSAGENFDRYVLPIKSALRIKYVKERSFWTDLKILAMTFVLVVKRVFGIYRSNLETKL